MSKKTKKYLLIGGAALVGWHFMGRPKMRPTS